MSKDIEFDRKEEMSIAKSMMDLTSGQVQELLINCDREDLLEDGKILSPFEWRNESLQSTCMYIVDEILNVDNINAIFEIGNVSSRLQRSTPELHKKIEDFLEEIDDESVEEIPDPELQKSTTKVFAALREARRAVYDEHPENSLDRFHTAFHGHLKVMCDEKGLQYKKNSRVDELYSILLKEYKTTNNLTNNNETFKLLKLISQFFIQLNDIRNHSSLAHPGGKLLDSDDALLFVNLSKTVLTFIIEKFK